MVLGAGGDEPLDIELGDASEEVLATLRAAANDRRKVLVDYYSFGRDEAGQRIVHPWRVFSAEGHWYLLAWCESVNDKRLFRVDRARSAAILDETFDPTKDARPPTLPESKPNDPVVVLDLASGAHWVTKNATPTRGRPTWAAGMYWSGCEPALRPGWSDCSYELTDATVVSGADGVAQSAARRLLGIYGQVTSER